MSLAAALDQVEKLLAKRIAKVAPFRAIVTAVDGQRITVRRAGATTADTQWYASCGRFLLAVDDEVLCAMLGGVPVVIDRIGRAAAASPAFSVQAAAGATASSTSSAGTDEDGIIQLVPGGAGLGTGVQLRITFAVARPSANFRVHLTPASSAARAAAASVGPTSRSTTKWDITADSALTGGSTYQWFYSVKQYAN